MEQEKYTINSNGGKHLRKEDRIMIERLHKHKYKPKEIAVVIGCSRRTIERELNRGEVEHINTDLIKFKTYSSDRAQDYYDKNALSKGPQLKLKANEEIIKFIQKHIVENKFSPDVIAALMDQAAIPYSVCTKTIYSYIDKGYIAGVSNDTLWEKTTRRKHKRKSAKRSRKQHAERTSIEKRPKHIDDREEFGHWEIDLVVGGKDTSKPVMLTIIERKTRRLIIRKLKDKTQESVLKALTAIERKFGAGLFRKVFISITSDNGSEFVDVRSMERSAFSKKVRVKLYYAHPYSSWERGSNENTNRIIRRFIPKGSDIGKFNKKYIHEIQEWINNYPRKILNYQTAEECFSKEMAA